MAGRRTRERVTTPDGDERVQTQPPRVDVLWYPAHRMTTVLVRRTHGLEVAAQLAFTRWDELLGDGLVDEPLGTDWDRARRVGWWWTGFLATRRHLPTDGLDQQGRVVRACRHSDYGAGAGIEYRP